MVIAIVTRGTSVGNPAQWQSSQEGVLAKITEVSKGEPGFDSVQYLWGSDEDGETGQISRWETLEDCRR